jgi:peptidoglycan hydrolase-like protein with peptidoglycan-binding domain
VNILKSVGVSGYNNYSDVKKVQNFLQKKGFSQLREDGICGPKTVQAIRDFQLKFMRHPDGRVDVNGRTWHNLYSGNSSPAPVSIKPKKNNHPISGLLSVRAGQVTFNAEGNDIPGSPYFSRVIHWPGNVLSGVTIGRGYDLGNRTVNAIYNDLTRSGVPKHQATMISEGAMKKGEEARLFVKNNRDRMGDISHAMQVNLFELIYSDYVSRARNNYNKWTGKYSGRVQWQDLKSVIRDILVDFVYQGFTRGEAPMKAGMYNDIDQLIHYIDNSTVMRSYEAGRQRSRYLRNNRG